MISQHSLKNTQYWIYNDNKKLPVIVMIHGLRGTHHGLDLIAKSLVGYRIIVPDLPGFGESKPLNHEHTLENYVNWLDNFILGLNLSKPPILLGHSFGSIICASYASVNPKTISKLILVNPIGSPALKGPKLILSQLAIMYYWLGKSLPETLGDRLLSAKPIVLATSIKLAKTRDKKLRKFIHDQHLQYFSTYENRKTLNEAFITSTRNNVRDVASEIKTSTLLIAGDLDDITPLKNQKELAKIFPKAKIAIINGVGHLTHYETPDKVAEEIIKFTR